MRKAILVMTVLAGLIAGDTLDVGASLWFSWLKFLPKRHTPDIPLGAGVGIEYFPSEDFVNTSFSMAFEMCRIAGGAWNIQDTHTVKVCIDSISLDSVPRWEFADKGARGSSLGEVNPEFVRLAREEGIRVLHFPGAAGRVSDAVCFIELY